MATDEALTPVHSDDMLHACFGDVMYEFDMIGHMTAAIARGTSDTPTRNAHLESLLLHLRNVHEFMVTKPEARKSRHLDDLIAWDYSGKVGCAVLEDGDRLRINKRLAHLSVTRAEDKARWNTGRLFTGAREALSLFLSDLEGTSHWPHVAARAEQTRAFVDAVAKATRGT
jgi:hypothetical protein